MKKLAIPLAMSVLLLGASAALAAQDPGGESKPKSASKPATTPKTPSRPNDAPRKNTPPPKSVPAGEVTVKTSLVCCAVSLDGKPRGATNQDGLLNLGKLTPGRHVIIVTKAGYEKQEREIELAANQSQFADIALTPLPVSLAISVNVPGARIEVNGQSYTDAVADVQLPPGTYPVKVSKSGYETSLVNVELLPAKPERLSISLERISAEKLLAQAEKEFGSQRYPRVIAACLDVLSVQPEQPRANYLLGRSYFNNGQYAASVSYLVKSIQLGEQVTLPVKHHHTEGRTILGQANDGLCSGQFILRKGAFEFQASDPSHSFNVAASKIYELALGSHKNTPRLHTKVGIAKGNKEEKKDFNFFADRAAVRKHDPNVANSINDVYCQDCQSLTDALYQILLQIKK